MQALDANLHTRMIAELSAYPLTLDDLVFRERKCSMQRVGVRQISACYLIGSFPLWIRFLKLQEFRVHVILQQAAARFRIDQTAIIERRLALLESRMTIVELKAVKSALDDIPASIAEIAAICGEIGILECLDGDEFTRLIPGFCERARDHVKLFRQDTLDDLSALGIMEEFPLRSASRMYIV